MVWRHTLLLLSLTSQVLIQFQEGLCVPCTWGAVRSAQEGNTRNCTNSSTEWAVSITMTMQSAIGKLKILTIIEQLLNNYRALYWHWTILENTEIGIKWFIMGHPRHRTRNVMVFRRSRHLDAGPQCAKAAADTQSQGSFSEWWKLIPSKSVSPTESLKMFLRCN